MKNFIRLLFFIKMLTGSIFVKQSIQLIKFFFENKETNFTDDPFL